MTICKNVILSLEGRLSTNLGQRFAFYAKQLYYLDKKL